MSWFNRKKNPYGSDTDDYLRTTDTVSRPLAIVFVILMVFVLAAVAFSLFLGGRWLYENLDGKTTTDTEIITGQVGDGQSNNEGAIQSVSDTTNNSSSTSTSSEQTNTPSGTPSSTAAPATSPVPTTPTPTSIPNTGPSPE